jgi:hypothetical protein
MRSAFAFFALALCAGCPATTVVTDLAIVTGCHQPEACMTVDCSCTRGAAFSTDTTNGGCISCLPNVAVDNCGTCSQFDGGSECKEPSEICYGKGPACPGAGALCMPAGTSCAVSQALDAGGLLASVPQPVQENDGDGGVSIVPHCPYVDDVCCPGSENTDMGVPDLAGADLSAVVPPDLLEVD